MVLRLPRRYDVLSVAGVRATFVSVISYLVGVTLKCAKAVQPPSLNVLPGLRFLIASAW